MVVLYSFYLGDSVGLGGLNAGLSEQWGPHILGHGLPVLSDRDSQVRPEHFDGVVAPAQWGCGLLYDK